MGNTPSNDVHEREKIFFNKKYNWVLSYPMSEYECINSDTINRITNTTESNNSEYIDHRNSCPPVLDIQEIPIHTISSVASMLNYQLIKNKLPIFPPSRLYIYNNCSYFPNVSSLLSFEIVFNSVQNFGFCSEVDWEYNTDNLNMTIPDRHYKVGEAFKYIKIYNVENSLEIIKRLLQNEMLLLIGIVLYYDLDKVRDRMWLPDISIDKKLGGTTGLLVGYIDSRESFIVKFSFGKNFGTSGYLLVPYKYILNKYLTPEIFYLDLDKNRVEGFLNQRKKTVSLENKLKEKKFSKPDELESFFQ